MNEILWNLHPFMIINFREEPIFFNLYLKENLNLLNAKFDFSFDDLY